MHVGAEHIHHSGDHEIVFFAQGYPFELAGERDNLRAFLQGSHFELEMDNTISPKKKSRH
jgi:hypothetical protein